MEEHILKIADDLRRLTIDEKQARTLLLGLFGVSGSLHHPIKFGRWLLKYAKEGWDEGLLCWQYEGKFYNTDELYEEFCRQQ